jgi:hypothetical protein
MEKQSRCFLLKIECASRNSSTSGRKQTIERPSITISDVQDEDKDHILRFTSDSRNKIREDMRDALHEFLEQPHTPDAVQISLTSGIFAWLNEREVPPPARNVSAELITTYKLQGKIGWGQVMRGRIAVHWSALVQHHLDSINNSDNPYSKKTTVDKMTADRWGTKPMSILYDFVLRLWDQRNIDEYGATTKSKTTTTKTKLLREVRQLQGEGAVMHNNRDWLYGARQLFD